MPWFFLFQSVENKTDLTMCKRSWRLETVYCRASVGTSWITCTFFKNFQNFGDQFSGATKEHKLKLLGLDVFL